MKINSSINSIVSFFISSAIPLVKPIYLLPFRLIYCVYLLLLFLKWVDALFFEKYFPFEPVFYQWFRCFYMFYSRNKRRNDLVCMFKVTTFAPALREKHAWNSGWERESNRKEIIFLKKFGSLKISVTFAAALREKLWGLKWFNNLLIKKQLSWINLSFPDKFSWK